MPNWQSPAELQTETNVFVELMHTLLGLYAYEWFISLDFEWDFITGTKKFRWPMIFYFANRYLLLLTLIGVAVALDSVTEINCQALYTFNQLAGNSAVGMASINLSIRTMAVWSQNRYIIGLLVVVMLGHWSLILQGVLLKAQWVPGVGCAITSTNNTILAAVFIYSMCFDLLVLCLNAYKLLGMSCGAAQKVGTSRLAKLIFSDGLIYFIIAFIANLTATVFMLLRLNAIMSVIFNVPAAVFSTIVACRAVRRLTKFTNQGPEVFASHSSHAGFPVTKRAKGIATKRQPTRAGVHVQMETFTQAEECMEEHDAESNEFESKEKGQQAVLPADYSTEVEGDLESKGAAL
ncbi:hypothetical protein JOM56_000302 [Amanita muscaria]